MAMSVSETTIAVVPATENTNPAFWRNAMGTSVVVLLDPVMLTLPARLG